jgi:hypothetical protein
MDPAYLRRKQDSVCSPEHLAEIRDRLRQRIAINVRIEMRKLPKPWIDHGLRACRNHIRDCRDHGAVHGMGTQAPAN